MLLWNVCLILLTCFSSVNKRDRDQFQYFILGVFGRFIFSLLWLVAVECDSTWVGFGCWRGFDHVAWLHQPLVQPSACSFNLVSTPAPFLPLPPQLKFHARPPGSSSVRHCSGHKDLQRTLLVNTGGPLPPSSSGSVSSRGCVRNVLLLWRTSGPSQPPQWSVWQRWRYYTRVERERKCHTEERCSVRKALTACQLIADEGFHTGL